MHDWFWWNVSRMAGFGGILLGMAGLVVFSMIILVIVLDALQDLLALLCL